jgi:hypothetical protein
MGQTTLATKFALINSLDEYSVQYLKQNAPGSETFESKTNDPATATSLLIEGYGRIDLPTLNQYVRVVKPAKATKNAIAIKAADVQLGTIENGDIVTFKLELTSNDARGEFNSRDSREHRNSRFEVRLNTNDTPATVLQKLAKELMLARTLFPEADGSGEPYTAVYEGGQLLVEAADAQLEIRLFVDDLFSGNTDLVPVFTQTELTPQFAGRGTYLQLKNVIRQTEGSNEIDGLSQGRDLPSPRSLYTEISFGTHTDRPDLSAGGAASDVVAQRPDFVLWVAESAANDAGLDGLLTFLSRSTGTKEYVKADGSAATVAELTAAPVPVATREDSRIASDDGNLNPL